MGYFFWGWVLDRSRRGRAPSERFRRLFAVLAVLSLPLAVTPLAKSLALVLALLCFSMFVAAGFVIVSLSEVTHRHSTEHGAYLAGLGAGSWSGVMALAMPLFGHLFDRGAVGFVEAYAIATSAAVAGWILWRVLAGRRSSRTPRAAGERTP
jgi:MFS transporter, ACS family, aldohexuronate transporter